MSRAIPFAGRARFLLKASVPFSPCRIARCPLLGRALSTDSRSDLFNYTSGHWVYNDAVRRDERRLVFDVDGLRRLAADSVGQSHANVVSLSKLAEGGFNRTFLITLRDGQRMVARIPYPCTVPKYYTIASEVATIEYLRSHGLPVPKIYGYSPDSNNAAQAEYILMEYVQGPSVADVWLSLSDQEVLSAVRQLTELETQMMSLSFPAGGSLYFAADLEKLAPGLGIPLDDKRFCVGPDTSLPLWLGRRTKLDVDRGPYRTAEAVLVAAARKELAYLEKFGQPVLPLRRERRPAFKYQLQLPSSHAEYLERYLSMTSSLVPKDPARTRFCIRHPDLQPNNIIVSRSPASGCQIIGLIDWQHTAILPTFLVAGLPQRFQNYDDPVSQAMTVPSRPDNIAELDEAEREHEEHLYRLRLAHYHFVTNIKERNPAQYAAFADPMFPVRGRLFTQARAPWEGESFDLKRALIDATENWKDLAGEGVPCPVRFDADDLRETAALDKTLDETEMGFHFVQNAFGIGEEGWVRPEDYEGAMASLAKFKEQALAGAESEEEREELATQWFWDDMDDSPYL